MTFASSNKTFFTIIKSTFSGIKFLRFSLVIHAPALVFLASFLYLIESKNVRSLFSAKCNGFILFTVKFFLNFIFGKTLFILIFFFLKKKTDFFH